MAACGWAWAAVRERRMANRWLGALVVTVPIWDDAAYGVAEVGVVTSLVHAR
jgi:hypothetical protein